MRITIDIDEKQLAGIQKETGIRKKSPAVRHALECYIRDMKKKRFLRKVMEGRSDYSLTNDQVEALGTYDID